jgi:hypothetical protein
MKKALISPLEIVSTGFRIAQVENTTFEVAEPLYWVDCPDDCNATTWYYNESELACEPIPIPIPTADENKQTAVTLLQQTDWTQIPSVSDPALSNPYLSNKLAFDDYRNVVRQYAVYPEAGNINWPTAPAENWIKV